VSDSAAGLAVLKTPQPQISFGMLRIDMPSPKKKVTISYLASSFLPLS